MKDKIIEYGEKVYSIYRSGFDKEINCIKEGKFIAKVMHSGHYFVVIDNGERVLTFEIGDVFRTKKDALEIAIKELGNEKDYHDEYSKRCADKINSFKAEFEDEK